MADIVLVLCEDFLVKACIKFFILDDSGDWVCPKDGCGTSNFASRYSCRICKTRKDGKLKH